MNTELSDLACMLETTARKLREIEERIARTPEAEGSLCDLVGYWGLHSKVRKVLNLDPPIATVSDLARVTEKEFRARRGCGRQTFELFAEFMQTHLLRFKPGR